MADLLDLALEASGAGTWAWDLRTGEVSGDARARRHFGFGAEDRLTFEAAAARLHDEDRSRVVAGLERAARIPGERWDAEFRVHRPDRTTAWIHGIGQADGAPAGPVTSLTGLSFDITAHKALETEYAETVRLLQETSGQGILSVDQHGTILTANSALESMLGWGPGELVGQPLARLVPDALREVHARHEQDYWANPTARPMGAQLHLVAQRRDGTTLPVEIGLNHVRTPSGRRAFAFVADISPRRRAEEELAARTRELEHRARQLQRLASELTLAEQHAREQLAKTLHDDLQQLLFSSRLKLDRLSARLTPRRPTETDLVDQARQTLDEAIVATRSFARELFPPMLHEGGLAPTLTWLSGWSEEKYGLLVVLTADAEADPERRDVRTLVFESVKELLFNVAKHAQTDRVAIDLALDADGAVRLTVADQGVGFDPAGVLDPGRAHVGGLGLFSIRERLALFGGRLDIDAAPGLGARFTVVVPRGPVATDAEAGRPRAIETSSDEAREPRTEPMTILIADDHPLVRDGLRQLLSERPELHVVGEATNGEEAVALARTLRPDAVIMDVSMPVMDGIEATRRIHAELPGVLILGLSTREASAGPHAIEEAGAAGYFTKGDDAHRLLDRLLRAHAGTGEAGRGD